MTDTPICVTSGLTYTCNACTSNSDCTSEYIGKATQATCVTQGGNKGACFTCNGDYGTGKSNACPDQPTPACHVGDAGTLAGRCTPCSDINASVCTNPLEPSCSSDGQNCGCNATSCPTGFRCDGDAGIAGACVSTAGCTATSCTTAPDTICDPTRNTCVQCMTSADCVGDAAAAGSTCNSQGFCAVADAGTTSMGDAGDDGGTSAGDDGGTITGSDAGDASSDGGFLGSPDATLNGGGSGDVTYPYGHIEGGGCIAGFDGSDTGSLASSFVTGLAALAGILSIRTRRRKNGQDQNR